MPRPGNKPASRLFQSTIVFRFSRAAVLFGCLLAAALAVWADPVPKAEPWPGGVVVYRFSAEVSLRFRETIRAAMEDWAKLSGTVVFVEAADTVLFRLAWYSGLETDLLIRRDDALRAFGRTSLGAGRWRFMDFNPAYDDPLWWRASFVHELGHVLGLLHEHQRIDRDNYIYIPKEFLVVAGPRAADYAVYDDWPAADNAPPYDYDSIMHYNSNIDGNRLIRLDTGQRILGVRLPSSGDIEKLRRLYAATLLDQAAVLRDRR